MKRRARMVARPPLTRFTEDETLIHRVIEEDLDPARKILEDLEEISKELKGIGLNIAIHI